MGAQDGEELRKQLVGVGIHLGWGGVGGGPGQGDFQILTQPWERGLNPTCRWGLMGSYEVCSERQ